MIHTLTPAESMMLMDPKGAKSKELLRITFLDLCSKGVLSLENKAQKGKKDLMYFCCGPHFKGYPFQLHEKTLVNTLRHKPSLRINFKQFMEFAARNFELDSYYKYERVASSTSLQPYFRQNIFQQKWGTKSLRSKGRKRGDIIASQIGEIDNAILFQEDANALFETLFPLGSHILLLTNLDKKVLVQVDPARVKKQIDKQAQDKSLEHGGFDQILLFWRTFYSWLVEEKMRNSQHAYDFVLQHFGPEFDKHANPTTREKKTAKRVISLVLDFI